MFPTGTIREKLHLFIHILWPILVSQISLTMMNVVDTAMSGRAGTADLAGVAIGSSLWLPVFTGIGGLWIAVAPIISQDLGRGTTAKIPEHVLQALYLSLVVSVVVIMAGSVTIEPVLSLMGLAEDVHHIAKHYLLGLAFGIIPLFASNVLRYFFDAHGLTRITMWIMLTAVPINVVLNTALIFGKWGFPRLGGIGAGYATAITYWIVFAISIVMALRVHALKTYRLFAQFPKPSWKAWKNQLAIGVPMGLSIFFEASIFAAVTLLMGTTFDTVTIAAHQAAISFTSLVFMFPLSISMALTITVAYEYGAGRLNHARQYTRLGIGVALGAMVVFSTLMYTFRGPIMTVYTSEAAVWEMGKMFLTFAIFYQLSDTMQASLQGVLRGYKDVTVPFIIALVSYWGIGLPTGYLLATQTSFGPFGFWLGITVGLTCAGLGFLLRLRIVQRRQDADALAAKAKAAR